MIRDKMLILLVGVAAAACSSEDPGFDFVVCPKPEYIHCVDGQPCPEPMLRREGFVDDLTRVSDGVVWAEGDAVYRYRDGEVTPVISGSMHRLAADSGFLYMVEYNRDQSRSIVRVGVDGSDPEVLVDRFKPVPVGVNPWADPTRLIWVSGSELWVMKLADRSLSMIASVSDLAGLIRSDYAAVYWTEHHEHDAGSRVMRYAPADGSVTTFWEGHGAGELFVRPDAVYLNTNRGLIRIDKKTGVESTIVEDPIIHSVRMMGDKVYYWNINDGGLYEQDLAGGDPTRLFTIESGGPNTFAVSETAAYMGFGNHCDIYRVDL